MFNLDEVKRARLGREHPELLADYTAAVLAEHNATTHRKAVDKAVAKVVSGFYWADRRQQLLEDGYVEVEPNLLARQESRPELANVVRRGDDWGDGRLVSTLDGKIAGSTRNALPLIDPAKLRAALGLPEPAPLPTPAKRERKGRPQLVPTP